MEAWAARAEGFVGREAERDRLRAALADARAGRPAAVVVRGEAGVGKTRLVAASLPGPDEVAVLWACCLRLGEVALPGLPLLTALDGWSAAAPAGSVLHDVPALPDLLAAVAEGRPSSPQATFAVVHRAVQALAGAGPTVLVVDDAQWADPTTRDLVAYLLADPRPLRLCLWLTWRDDPADRDAASAWLTDVRRLPAVTELELSRFDEEDTRRQLGARLETEPDPEVVRQLFARTDGNAYFNELLADQIDAATGRLPGVVPEALRTALLTGWQRLSGPARQVLRLLGVAGRPTTTAVLARVAAELGVGGSVGGSVGEAVREAVGGGALRRTGDTVWFHHPLIAEVVVDDLLPDELAERHRAFARAVGDQVPLADLARHQALGGLVDEAFTSCLAGAAEAEAAGAFELQSTLLVRAAELHPQLSSDLRHAQQSEAALCGAAAHATRRTGDTETALRLAERARVVLDTEPDSDRRAALLTLWAQLVSVESGGPVRSALEEAIRLAAPDSAARAGALTWLADEERRAGELAAAREHAEQAVTTARASGDLEALALAAGIRVHVSADPESDAEEAWQAALQSGVPEALGLAAIARANQLDRRGLLAEGAEHMLAASRRAMDAGVSGLAHLLGAYTATILVEVGRFDEAAGVLRRVLASAPRGLSGNQARQAAAVLAVRRGDLDEADRHVAWLFDMTGPLMDTPGLYGPATLAEHHLAHRRPDDALAVLARTLGPHAAAEPAFGARLLGWAARAAADLADRARHDHDDAGVAGARAALRTLEAEHAAAGSVPAGASPVVAAWRAVTTAERKRCAGTATAADWRAAAARCAAATMPYEEANALLRQVALTPARAEASGPLRRAHALAAGMGAAPLRLEAEALAVAARVSLADPTTPTAPKTATAGPGPGWDALTRREREVLGHLVAGRTYAEIAVALFISEKTVSVHVSNLLRKTGTSSRVEAAAWARREGIGPADA
jgi:DNA-binding CsgD family transcriptional regulator